MESGSSSSPAATSSPNSRAGMSRSDLRDVLGGPYFAGGIFAVGILPYVGYGEWVVEFSGRHFLAEQSRGDVPIRSARRTWRPIFGGRYFRCRNSSIRRLWRVGRRVLRPPLPRRTVARGCPDPICATYLAANIWREVFSL